MPGPSQKTVTIPHDLWSAVRSEYERNIEYWNSLNIQSITALIILYIKQGLLTGHNVLPVSVANYENILSELTQKLETFLKEYDVLTQRVNLLNLTDIKNLNNNLGKIAKAIEIMSSIEADENDL